MVDAWGRKYTTCVFGLFITFVCPLLFRVSNVLFGLIVTNGEFGITTFKHVIMTWQQQLVIIHDISLFNTD